MGTTLAVCYLDLDGFKPVNDTLGHQAGDALLIEIARRLRSAIRGGDTIARIGGDEFVLLLVGLEPTDEYKKALERILVQIGEPVQIGSHSAAVSASIGITLYPTDNSDPDLLLRHADQAMYQAKQAGRNRLRFFEDTIPK
jgi:diguanylate cyclase (GGDEF)-like protein